MSGWPRRGGWREIADSGSGDGPRAAGGRSRPGRRVGEGGRLPARTVALDGEAPPGQRAVEGGGDDHRSACVDPRAAAARAPGSSPGGGIAKAAVARSGSAWCRGQSEAACLPAVKACISWSAGVVLLAGRVEADAVALVLEGRPDRVRHVSVTLWTRAPVGPAAYRHASRRTSAAAPRTSGTTA